MPRSSAPLTTAAGCISAAAAAIRTVSRSARSRPAAKACRNAAIENATTRPACLAYVATSIAHSVSGESSGGHLSGMSPYPSARRSTSAR